MKWTLLGTRVGRERVNVKGIAKMTMTITNISLRIEPKAIETR